jgi:hypothetical protein
MRLLPAQGARKPFAMRPVHRRTVRDTAALYRACGSQKRLGAALELDQSNVSRLVNAETPSSIARAVEDLERMELSGISTAALVTYVRRRVHDARLAYQRAADRSPLIRRAS